MRRVAAGFAALCLAGPVGAPVAAEELSGLKAGTYRLDPHHATLTFRVNHIGISTYAAGFDSFEATLELDPADPSKAVLRARVEVASLDTPLPPEGFREMLLAAPWFDVENHPDITFESNAVELKDDVTAEVAGVMVLNGREAPVRLTVTALGGYEGFDLDPNARIGFHAEGAFDRSDFGFTVGLPPEGTTLGVSDRVEFTVDAEFIGPAWEG